MIGAPLPPDDTASELRGLLGTGQFREVLTRYGALPEAARRGRPELSLLGATAAMRLGDLARAAAFAEQSLDGFRGRTDQDGEMRALNLLGVIGIERGALGEAEQALRAALERAERLGDALLSARAANNLATLNYLRGEAAGALGMYQGALLAYQRLGDRRGAAETYHNLGIVYRMLASWREADTAIVQAVRHAELVGERSLLALAVMGRAELELEQGELDVAERGLERAIALATEAGDELGITEALKLRALLTLRRGEYAAAATAADQALAEAERLGGALLAAESAAVAALAHRKCGARRVAEERAATARRGFALLGAEAFLARFERDWGAA